MKRRLIKLFRFQKEHLKEIVVIVYMLIGMIQTVMVEFIVVVHMADTMIQAKEMVVSITNSYL